MSRCPSCGSTNTVIKVVSHKFPYGQEKDRVWLVVDVPTVICSQCHGEFIGAEGTDAMQAAVDKHAYSKYKVITWQA
jgi:YgiT-type zinc finger domain-containing protein